MLYGHMRVGRIARWSESRREPRRCPNAFSLTTSLSRAGNKCCSTSLQGPRSPLRLKIYPAPAFDFLAPKSQPELAYITPPHLGHLTRTSADSTSYIRQRCQKSAKHVRGARCVVNTVTVTHPASDVSLPAQRATARGSGWAVMTLRSIANTTGPGREELAVRNQ